MPKKCCVDGCENKRQQAILFKFPVTNETGLRKWLQCLNKAYLWSLGRDKLSKMVVCHNHFEARFTRRRNLRTRLIYGAYPSLFTAEEISTGLPSLQTEVKENVSIDHSYAMKQHFDHTYCKSEPIDHFLSSIENFPVSTGFSNISEGQSDYSNSKTKPRSLVVSSNGGIQILSDEAFINQSSTCFDDQTFGSFVDQTSESFGDQHSASFVDQLSTCFIDQPSPSFVDQPSTCFVDQPSASFVDQPSISVVNQPSTCFFHQPSTSFVDQPSICVDQSSASIDQPSTSVADQTSTSLAGSKPATKKRNRFVHRLKDLTPAALKLYKEYVKAKNSAKYRKRTEKSLSFYKKNSFEKLSKKLNAHSKTFIEMQLRLCNKKARGRRFTLQEKQVALDIMKQSTKCYQYLHRIFILPSISTLTNELTP